MVWMLTLLLAAAPVDKDDAKRKAEIKEKLRKILSGEPGKEKTGRLQIDSALTGLEGAGSLSEALAGISASSGPGAGNPSTRPDPLVPVRIGEAKDTTGATVRYEIDESTATFRLETPEEGPGAVGPVGMGGNLGAILDADRDGPRLYGTFREAARGEGGLGYPILPSVEMFNHHGKMLNDGIVAAIELALEEPVGERWPGKRAWIEQMIAAVNRDGDSDSHRAILLKLAGAHHLGGYDLDGLVDPGVASDARALADAWVKKSPSQSKPIGFYTWSAALERVFRRDRYLMSPYADSGSDLQTILVVADVMRKNPPLAEAMAFFTALYGRLTNPPAGGAAFDAVPEADALLADPARAAAWVKTLATTADGVKLYIWPPAGSAETEFINELGGTARTGANTMRLLIDAVKSGKVNLDPSADSGWYAHTQYALQPLLRLEANPEGEKIDTNKGYDQRLEMAFASLMTMHRETHVKMLSAPGIGAAAPEPKLYLDVAPDLRVEPIPTHYLRMARAYGFLRRNVLDGVFGESWAALAPLVGGQPSATEMAQALAEMETLFQGLYLAASVTLGMRPDVLAEEIPDPVAAANAALGWFDRINDLGVKDAFLDEDVRVAVPMGQHPLGTILWAVIGIRAVELTVDYDQPPEVRLLGKRREFQLRRWTRKYTLLIPIFTEVVYPSPAPPTRAELRALCDEHKHQGRIEAALAGVTVAAGNTAAPPAEPTGCGCTGRAGSWAWIAVLAAGCARSFRRRRGYDRPA